jgi:hypothetical protein
MGILNHSSNKKNEFFITPDGRKWGVNIDNFTKICLTSDKEKSKDTEITEGFEKLEDGSLVQTSKIVREVNSQGNMQNDTIKYDLLKTLLNVVLDKNIMSFGNLEAEMEVDFSFNLAFNTLRKLEIIYEIK